MKDEKQNIQIIQIPEGTFEGNCRDCVYAGWNDTDRYGRVYCRGSYGGYNKPEDRNGCFHYKYNERLHQGVIKPHNNDQTGLSI